LVGKSKLINGEKE